jgi:rhamnosyltransferase
LDHTSVCAIFVTYHPNAALAAEVARVTRQVGGVVIVDNGSVDAELQMLGRIATDPSVSLVLNGANLGLARALNIGLQRAAARGFSFVLLFDQDSRADDDMVQTLLAVRASLSSPERVAIVGAAHRERHRPPKQVLAPGDELLGEEVDWLITSGSLLWLAAASVIGPFREDFFIDYIDTEYCWRARALGYRLLKTKKPLMSHSIGLDDARGETAHELAIVRDEHQACPDNAPARSAATRWSPCPCGWWARPSTARSAW